MGAKTFEEIGGPAARRHLFLCTGPDCCSTADGLKTWEHLKASLKQCPEPMLRTKAACLRMCHDGPWLVVYPEGVWYTVMDNHDVDEIVESHLKNGQVVDRLKLPADVGR